MSDKGKQLVTIRTWVSQRENGWYIEMEVDGRRTPGEGPHASEAEANRALADLRGMIGGPKGGSA